jgi:hypothetical protein
MKKTISTIIAIVIISSIVTTSAFAGDRHHGGGINPLWIPVAILSTLAAAVTISQPQVTYERRVYSAPPRTVVYEEPRQTVVYTEPRHHRIPARYNGREPVRIYYDEYGRAFETHPQRHYR